MNADRITPRAGVVLTAYTGRLCAPFPDFHRYAEEVLGRPILTHEFAEPGVWIELRAAAKPEFLAIVGAPLLGPDIGRPRP